MKVVVDTNIFLAVALNEPEKTAIVRLTQGHHLAAPDVLSFEIGNALSAMFKRQRLDLDEALAAWDIIQLIPVELRSVDIRNALKIANHYDIYAYDAYFLECAHKMHSPLITLDRRMGTVAKEIGIQLLEVAK